MFNDFMEDLLKIPGLLDRMIEAKIMPSLAVAAPPLPPVPSSVTILQVPAVIPPLSTAV